MSAAIFDTAAAVRRMEDAGLSREAAEAVAATAREAGGADRDVLATKADLAELEARMLERLNALQWRMVGLAAVIVAAVKLIP